MASRRTFTRKAAKGFTLIEILIVLGMFAIVGGLGLIVSMDTFRNYSFKDERDLIVSALQKARSQSVSNMCFGTSPVCTDGKPHGVKIISVGGKYQYVIFQGTSYANRTPGIDEALNSVYSAVTLSGFNEVVFSTLSGNASTSPRTLSVGESAGVGSSVITVGSEGQILWTK